MNFGFFEEKHSKAWGQISFFVDKDGDPGVIVRFGVPQPVDLLHERWVAHWRDTLQPATIGSRVCLVRETCFSGKSYLDWPILREKALAWLESAKSEMADHLEETIKIYAEMPNTDEFFVFGEESIAFDSDPHQWPLEATHP